jgi:hypothetical protein
MIQMIVGYGKGNSVEHHFQQFFGYIVAVSFIGGGSRNTRRKSRTCRKSLAD